HSHSRLVAKLDLLLRGVLNYRGAFMTYFHSRSRNAWLVSTALASLPAAGVASAQTPIDPQASTLEDIVVTASGFEQRVTQAPASITVIPRSEIQQQRATSIAELLTNVEGVDVGGAVGKTGGQTVN